MEGAAEGKANAKGAIRAMRVAVKENRILRVGDGVRWEEERWSG